MDKFIPLQTISELFTTLTEVFVPQEIVPQQMYLDPLTSPVYNYCLCKIAQGQWEKTQNYNC